MKFNIKELRIGNFVKSGKGIYEIALLSPDGIEGIKELHEDKYIMTDDTLILSPIEITKDWLIKLGFVNEKDYWYNKNVPNSETIFSINIQSKHILTGSNGIWFTLNNKPIKYIHNLQNLFYDLFNVELIINNDGK